VLPLNGIQIDDTGRKVVFPNIKNKFRFVTVSLMLGSLVTVISSASAAPPSDDYGFDINVTECTETGFADWRPEISDVFINAGDSGTATVTTNFADGTSVCDGTLPVDGTVSASLSISQSIIPVTGWNIAVTECSVSCSATVSRTEIYGTFDVPLDADEGLYSGTFTLIWMPIIPLD
jgi:hypothetical protein